MQEILTLADFYRSEENEISDKYWTTFDYICELAKANGLFVITKRGIVHIVKEVTQKDKELLLAETFFAIQNGVCYVRGVYLENFATDIYLFGACCEEEARQKYLGHLPTLLKENKQFIAACQSALYR